MQHEAGRDLDALVAEKVMGWEWYTVVGVNVMLPPDHHYRENAVLATLGRRGHDDDIDSLRFRDPVKGGAMLPIVPHYSTDIAAAWLVVERLHSQGLCVGVSTLHGWKTKCECSIYYAETMGEMVANADATTAPLAICLAVLEAMEARHA